MRVLKEAIPFIQRLNFAIGWSPLGNKTWEENLIVTATQSQLKNKTNGWTEKTNVTYAVQKTVTVDLSNYVQVNYPGFDRVPIQVHDSYFNYYPNFYYDLRCIPWFGPNPDKDGENTMGEDAGSCKYIYNTCGAWDTLPYVYESPSSSIYRQITDISVLSSENPSGLSLKGLGNQKNVVGFNYRLYVCTSGIGGISTSMSGNSLYHYCLSLGELAYCKIGNINAQNRKSN